MQEIISVFPKRMANISTQGLFAPTGEQQEAILGKGTTIYCGCDGWIFKMSTDADPEVWFWKKSSFLL